MKNSELSKIIDKKIDNHRTIPFWSWNDKLEKDELIKQMDEMKKVGMAGVFMHARAGLKTPYMKDEWMSAVKTCMEYGKKIGLETWAYDENGWPSGFANGKVPELGYDYQQKSLIGVVIEDNTILPENTIGVYRLLDNKLIYSPEEPKVGDLVIVEKVNKYYIDTFNPEAIEKFIIFTHEKYNKEFPNEIGKGIRGFFTDEPQYGNGEIPWSWKLLDCYKNEYNANLIPKLGDLFFNTDTSDRFRWEYYDMVGKRYRECFLKQMQDWCHKHNCELTGHVMAEDDFVSQISCTGGAMPCYEFFDMPGVDWLGRNIAGPMIPLQIGSAAMQLGREKVITESFALCGWDVSFQELRNITQWQFMYGVNRLCQHLTAYTIKGLRKRDYPPSLHIQSPWFEKYSIFQNYASRLGTYLSEGESAVDVLLISSLHASRAGFSGFDKSITKQISNEFESISDSLNKMLIPHHYGDETILKLYGKVENDKLIVGKMVYDTVIIPPCKSLDSTTWDLLEKFAENGGKIYAVKDIPSMSDFVSFEMDKSLKNAIIKVNDITEIKKYIIPRVNITQKGKSCSQIQMNVRILEDNTKLYFFANLTSDEIGECLIKLPDNKNYVRINIETGEEIGLHKTDDGYLISFNSYEGIMIIESEEEIVIDIKTEEIRLNPIFEVKNCTENALTLDKCEYRINNGEWQKELAVILLQDKLLRLEKSCNVEMRFKVTIDKLSDIGNTSLVIETPEKFEIMVNDKKLIFKDKGYYVDKSFRKCDIREFLNDGENQIVLKTFFTQDEKLYRIMFDDSVHEAEKNKLTLDSELESIYLLGDFSVQHNGDIKYLERRAMSVSPEFTISKSTKKVNIRNITPQGYWFFSGKINLVQYLKIDKQQVKRYILKINKLYACVASVTINNKYVGDLSLIPFELDVTDFIIGGKNQIEILLYSGCRNLLGPHHRKCGESYFVGPFSFTDKAGWHDKGTDFWTDNYSMVLFGIEP